jgi:outer membrane protein assembly factor BamB
MARTAWRRAAVGWAAWGAAAAAWAGVGWRTDGTGSYADADPPQAWGVASNVVWKTALPDWSNATPVPVGDRVFVCAERARLLCLSARDGAILWERGLSYADVLPPGEAARAEAAETEIAEIRAQLQPIEKELRGARQALKKTPDDAALTQKAAVIEQQAAPLRERMKPLEPFTPPETHAANGYSTATPCSDGQRVFVVYGLGLAAAYDLEGRRLWARRVDRPRHGWGFCASPVLAGGRLVLHMEQLQGLDPATGETVWTVPAGPRWGSPVAAPVGGVDVVVTAGGDFVRATDGRVLASMVAALEYCAPLVRDGVAYFIENGGKAVKLPATADAPFTPEVLWTTQPPKERYYASPVLRDGMLYAVQQQGLLSAIDAKTGAVVFSQKLPVKGTAYPSVASAGRYLFASGERGSTVVFEPGPAWKQVALNELEPFRSSPVFAGGRLYVRGSKHLYAIGK